MAAGLGLTGLARELASNCEFVAMDEQVVTLRLAPEHRQLAAGRGPARLEKALAAYLGRSVKLDLQVAQRVADTPAEIGRRRDEKRRAEAARTLESDPGVAAILEAFDGSIEPDSVRPLD
jgi:DNA polymerase-3 subunit gamma/tau